MVFNSEAAFLAAANVVSTETFDEFASGTDLGGPSATVDGITYTAVDPDPGPPPPPRWSVHGSTVADSPPNVFEFSGRRAVTLLSFGDGMITHAIGFFLHTGADFPGGVNYELTVTLGNDSHIVANASGGALYRGFLASEGIKSITIDTETDIGGFNFEFDNVSRGAIVPVIPEPATWLLVLVLGPSSLCLRCTRR
jgi:hypothetical protein